MTSPPEPRSALNEALELVRRTALDTYASLRDDAVASRSPEPPEEPGT